MSRVNPGDLPPVQQLVLEVLVARARTAESTWTFANRVRPALTALAGTGLLWWKPAPVAGYCLAGLTGRGRETAISAGYAIPGEVTVEWGARYGTGNRVRSFGEDEEARNVSRMIADDFARAGQSGKPVCRRVIRERWAEYPDEFWGIVVSEEPS